MQKNRKFLFLSDENNDPSDECIDVIIGEDHDNRRTLNILQANGIAVTLLDGHLHSWKQKNAFPSASFPYS